MKHILKYILHFVLFASFSFVQAQHEVTVEDIGGNGDAVIEIVVDSSENIDPRKMILGLNQSSEGFLRMRTNHDLSFWTFNKKRMTVTNTGEIAVGTSNALEKLYVKNGSLGLETETSGLFDTDERSSINFYTDSDYKAGITYGDTQADGKFMSFNNTDNSAFFWRSNSQTRMILNTDGSLRIHDLDGDGQRKVFASNNGILESDPTLFNSVNPSDFKIDPIYRDNGDLRYFTNELLVEISGPLNALSVIASPAIPFDKYFVEEVIFFYLDNISGENMLHTVYVIPLGQGIDSFSESTSGSSSSYRQQIVDVSRIIDESNGDLLQIRSTFRDEHNHALRKVLVKYRPL